MTVIVYGLRRPESIAHLASALSCDQTIVTGEVTVKSEEPVRAPSDEALRWRWGGSCASLQRRSFMAGAPLGTCMGVGCQNRVRCNVSFR